MHDGIVIPRWVIGVRGGAVTFSGKVQIDVCLPGQNRPFVALKVVWTHVRMQMAPVVVGNSRVVIVAWIVGGVAMMTDGTDIRRNGGSLDARKAGHATKLLSRGWFWGFELSVDVIRGRGGERK